MLEGISKKNKVLTEHFFSLIFVICDGYIIAVNDVIYSIDQKKTNLCIPQNLSIKNIRSSIINFIIDNAELMSIEANKVVGKFFINNFGCNN